jgi:hypothetical protein
MFSNGFIWKFWVAFTVTIPSSVPIHVVMGARYDGGKDC